MSGRSDCGYQWSESLAQWEPAVVSSSLSGRELSVATWNVWFGEYGFEQRSRALLAELEQCRPDIIGVQEVTPRLLRLIARCHWVRREYTLSEIEPEAMGDYGCLILSRRAPHVFYRIALPGTMNRYALAANFSTDDGTLTFVNVHLESTKTQHCVRGQQLQVIFQALEATTPVVFVGDFNFCSSNRVENQRIDLRYTDLWPEVHPDAYGFTEDTAMNSMRLALTGKEKQVRYDRILLRDDSGRWRALSMELLGTEELEPELFISDHFGLSARLRKRWGCLNADARSGSY